MQTWRGSWLARQSTAYVAIIHKKALLAYQQGFSIYQSGQSLYERYFNSVWAFFALGYFKLHFVILANFADEVGYVDEYVLAGAVYFDEAEAFSVVEKFYGSGLHDARGIKDDKASSSEP
jgi:hypothetical protein